MNLRVFNQRFLEPITMALMVIGILFLCQPWIAVLHQWSVLVMLIGLIGFNVAVHIKPPDADPQDEPEPGPVSVSRTVREGTDNG